MRLTFSLHHSKLLWGLGTVTTRVDASVLVQYCGLGPAAQELHGKGTTHSTDCTA